MHVNLGKSHVYQKLKVDEYSAYLSMSLHQFVDRQNIVYNSLRHFEIGIETCSFILAVTIYQFAYCLCLV